MLADRRMAARRTRTGQVLAVEHGRRHGAEDHGPAGEDPVAGRTRLPRTEHRPRPGPLRGPLVRRLAPPRHPRRARPGVLHPAAPGPGAGPKSGCAGLTLYAVLRELQLVLAV